jgi:hypothetical protein
MLVDLLDTDKLDGTVASDLVDSAIGATQADGPLGELW